MKLVCINTELSKDYLFKIQLQENKIYEGELCEWANEKLGYLIKIYHFGVDPINDNPEIQRFYTTEWLPAECFIPLSEWRDKQIKDILE